MCRPPTPARPPRRGLTLVELLVTLAITAAMMLLAVAFGIAWTNGAQVVRSRAMLQGAFSVAKSVALQNPAQQILGNTAAVFCFSSGTVNVYAGGSCSGTASWQGSLPSGVSVSFGGAATAAATACIALTNTGTAVTGAGTNCVTNPSFRITKGPAYVAQGSFY